MGFVSATRSRTRVLVAGFPDPFAVAPPSLSPAVDPWPRLSEKDAANSCPDGVSFIPTTRPITKVMAGRKKDEGFIDANIGIVVNGVPLAK
ncbi:MAG: hypothetical protein H8M99_12460 [Gloeobacteraceae cyanobacterium ES-bin-144]|nr:hypothetical protein [Verrucomicrobiales bacterium]